MSCAEKSPAAGGAGERGEDQNELQVYTGPEQNQDALVAAGRYIRRGWSVVPVRYRGKRPIGDKWNELRIAEADLPKHFGGRYNIGVLLGDPSGGLVDVDLDCPEAVMLGGRLPETGLVFGREGKPRSHRLYVCPGAPTERLRAPDGTTLVELRSTGAQTVFPDSVHECGESIEWSEDGDALRIDRDLLVRAVRELGAAALLARYWPKKGARHDAALALAGGLLRAGWSVKHVVRFMLNVATAAHDDEVEDRVRAVMSTSECLNSADGMATGWPVLAKMVGEAVVKSAMGWLDIQPVSQSAGAGGRSIEGRASALARHERPWPALPDEAAFHGLAGRIVRMLEPHSEADPVALLIQMLAAYGNIIGRGAHFRVEGDRHFATMYVVLVGPTGKGRKGTSWGRVASIFRTADLDWVKDRVPSGGMSSGEGLIWAVRDPIFKREPIRQKRTIVGYQSVEVDPGVADKRLLTIESEFASVLKVMSREGNTLSATIRRAWDGHDVLQTLTKNSPAKATGAHVSIIGHITCDELLRHLNDTELLNGFGNRFLWCVVRRSKFLPEGGGVLDNAGPLAREVEAAVSFGRAVEQVGRDQEARELWASEYARLSSGRPGLLGAALGRAEANAMRLAMLYALLDRSHVIRREHLEAALALWDYCERSAGYIFGDALGDPAADAIHQALLNNGGGLRRDQLHALFGRHRQASEIDRALGILLRERRAHCVEERTGGRPAERWFAGSIPGAESEESEVSPLPTPHTSHSSLDSRLVDGTEQPPGDGANDEDGGASRAYVPTNNRDLPGDLAAAHALVPEAFDGSGHGR